MLLWHHTSSSSSIQVRHGSERREKKERYKRDNEHTESVAERTQEESVPHQGREDHAGYHYQDDAHPGVHVVRQRSASPQEGEQNDVGAPESRRGRRQQQ